MQTPASQPSFAPFAASMPRVSDNRVLDLVAVILLFLLIPIDLPLAQPLRAPAAVFLLAYAVIHWRGVVSILGRAPWILLIPAFCALSALWADTPGAALRQSMLILYSIVIAGVVAQRSDLKQILLALLLSQTGLAVATLLTMTTVWVGGADGGMALIGVFPHKNVAGLRMVFLLMAAGLVLFAKGYPVWAKATALAAVPMAIFVIVASYSASARILVVGTLPLLIFLAVMWRGVASIRGGRALLLVTAVTALVGAGLVAVNTVAPDPAEKFLDLSGKDRTLTGRTELWETANYVASQHPVLGVGAGNYWQADNGQASSLAARMGGGQAENFSFHSLAMELRVHLGAVGLIALLPIYVLWVWGMVRAWGRSQTALNAAFVIFPAVFTLRALFESELFRPLTFTSILFFVIGFAAIAAKPRPETIETTPSSA